MRGGVATRVSSYRLVPLGLSAAQEEEGMTRPQASRRCSLSYPMASDRPSPDVRLSCP
jgi:hypothetical protein